MTLIRCGHCKGQHESVDQVKSCSRAAYAARVFDVPVEMVQPPTPSPELVVNEKTFNLDVVVPDGRYAIYTWDGELRFYRVERPTQGRWEGVTFVSRQAGDELYPVRGREKKAVLKMIYTDPQSAMLRYGREIGTCGHCGRTLTNEISRLAGIGPICRSKMGW